MINPGETKPGRRVLIKFFDDRGMLVCNIIRPATEVDQVIQAVKDQMWELAHRTVERTEVLNL